MWWTTISLQPNLNRSAFLQYPKFRSFWELLLMILKTDEFKILFFSLHNSWLEKTWSGYWKISMLQNISKYFVEKSVDLTNAVFIELIILLDWNSLLDWELVLVILTVSIHYVVVTLKLIQPDICYCTAIISQIFVQLF